jgi:molybdate transport system substrate-binding protein
LEALGDSGFDMTKWKYRIRSFPTTPPAMKNLSLLLAALVFSANAHAAETSIAVASNFAEPIKAVVAGFEKSSGHTVKVSTGASGKFYAQIVNGAPFDVMLSADDETPAKLVAGKQAVAGTAFTYATGKLALWSAKAGVVDGSADALKRDYRFVAIANPKLAPYGRAAMETLAALKILVPPAKLATGENIGQTYQFAQTGNADFGFVALSQVWKDGKFNTGSGWIVPATLHTPIRQDAVLLEKGRNNAAASALLAYLKTPAVRALIARYGYGD